MSESMNTSEVTVCKMFDELYDKLVAEGGSRKIKGLFSDEMGFLLLDVCELIPHAPRVGSIAPLDSVFASGIDGAPALVYTFYYNPSSMGENALIFLVRMGDGKIRLFAVETHCGSYYLCEYYGNRHINYGQVAPEELAERVAEKLNYRRDDKTQAREDKNENVNFNYNKRGFMKIAGIILIVLQVISLIPSVVAGDNIFSYGFANLLGRFIFGIVGVALIIIANKKNKNG